MNPIIITQASHNNLAVVQKIGRETFFETFAEANKEEDTKKYLAENFSDAKLTAELSNPGSQFFIAWDGENPVGYLKINSGTAQTELQDTASMEIERIYVKADYHGKKLASSFMKKHWKKHGCETKLIYGWVYGRKIPKPSAFTKKTALLHLISIFSNLVKTNR